MGKSNAIHHPLVSVVMPVYNTSKYLRQTLGSLINQTLSDIEIICVNDGSTDRSLEILREYEKSDPRVVVLDKMNQGAAAARNAGLEMARGRYLSILDSDDFFEPDMLEKSYFAAINQRADIVVFRSNQKEDTTGKFKETPWTVKSNQIPALSVFSFADIRFNRFHAVEGWTWDKLFLRSFIEKNNIRFQSQKIYNDLLFTFSACILADRITFFDDVLVHQRKRGGGSLSDEGSSKWGCLFSALAALRDEMLRYSEYERYEKDFLNYVVRMVVYHLSISGKKDQRSLLHDFTERWIPFFGLSGKEDSFFDPISTVAELKLAIDEADCVR